jgi:hypothetical protein
MRQGRDEERDNFWRILYRDTRIYLAMTAPGSVEEDDSILLHFVNLFVIVGRNYLNGFAFK